MGCGFRGLLCPSHKVFDAGRAQVWVWFAWGVQEYRRIPRLTPPTPRLCSLASDTGQDQKIKYVVVLLLLYVRALLWGVREKQASLSPAQARRQTAPPTTQGGCLQLA